MVCSRINSLPNTRAYISIDLNSGILASRYGTDDPQHMRYLLDLSSEDRFMAGSGQHGRLLWIPGIVGLGRFFPQLPKPRSRLAKKINTTSFCQNQGRASHEPAWHERSAGISTGIRVHGLSLRADWHKVKELAEGGKEKNMMLLSCHSSVRSRSGKWARRESNSLMVKSAIHLVHPVLLVHPPTASSRLPHPGLGRGKAQAKNTTCQWRHLHLDASDA